MSPRTPPPWPQDRAAMSARWAWAKQHPGKQAAIEILLFCREAAKKKRRA